MGTVRDSLQENLEAIREALPPELRDGLEARLAEAEEPAALDEEQEKQAIIQELRDNPDVDDAECVPQFEQDCAAHRAPPAPSSAEQEAQMKEMLAEREAEVAAS